MITQRLALPIRVLKLGRQSEQLCGSGFIASVGDETYLVTVAHLPYGGLQQGQRWIVTNKWEQWAGFLILVLEDGKEEIVQLFRTTAFGNLSPRFGYTQDPQDPQRIFDVMWIALTDLASHVRAQVVKEQHIFSLDSYVLATAGNSLRGIGYPVQSGQQQTVNHSEAPGTILTHVSGHYLSDANTTPGYSGGPVVDSANDLLGITIGFAPEPQAHHIILAADSVRQFLTANS